VYVACVRPNQVALLTGSGKVQWKRQERQVTVGSISASEDGRLLAIGSEQPGDVVDVTVVNSRNQSQWTAQRPGRGPRVRLCAAGTAAMLTYEHRVQHQNDTRFERRLAYFTLSDAGSWTRGGAYSAPLYLAVDRNGAWVVALETQDTALPYLRLYGSGGERRWKYDCAAPVVIAVSSLEGRSIAAYRQDGMLELVRVRPS
jgi:hypothetical protein